MDKDLVKYAKEKFGMVPGKKKYDVRTGSRSKNSDTVELHNERLLHFYDNNSGSCAEFWAKDIDRIIMALLFLRESVNWEEE